MNQYPCRVRVEYGIEEDGTEGRSYDASDFRLTESEADAILTILTEIIRPDWTRRSITPS